MPQETMMTCTNCGELAEPSEMLYVRASLVCSDCFDHYSAYCNC